MACSVVLTWRREAVIYVHFTVIAEEPFRAFAQVAPGAGVLGGGGAQGLDADECRDAVSAGSAILAWGR